MFNSTGRISLFVFLALACSGCADLKIKIYSYTGDETYSGDAQLAEAVGEAAQANMTAKQFLARIEDEPTHYGKAWTMFQQSLEDLVCDYENTDAIELHVKNFDDPSVTPAQHAIARHDLAVVLVRYGQRCIAMGQQIGIPAENHFFWPFYETGRQPVIAGVAIENAGAKVQRLAGNVLDQCEFTPLASIYKSLLPGMVEGQIDPQEPVYQSLNDSSNWKLVNTQYFTGCGNLNDVVIKDEVGNWIQKSFSNDPTGVIDATFDGATLVVDTLAAAYGVPLPKTTGNTSGKSDSSDASTDPNQDLESKAQEAKNTVAQLNKLQANLKENLTQILGDNSLKDDERKNQIVTTLEVYQTRLNSLASADADDTSAKTPATPPKKPAATKASTSS